MGLGWRFLKKLVVRQVGLNLARMGRCDISWYAGVLSSLSLPKRPRGFYCPAGWVCGLLFSMPSAIRLSTLRTGEHRPLKAHLMPDNSF